VPDRSPDIEQSVSSALDEIVGVRFPGRQSLVWFRAGEVPASPRSFVVTGQDGAELVGQVIVGRGQCLAFPCDPAELPVLIREALPEERAGETSSG
jgi:hypothetical protein